MRSFSCDALERLVERQSHEIAGLKDRNANLKKQLFMAESSFRKTHTDDSYVQYLRSSLAMYEQLVDDAHENIYKLLVDKSN